MMFNSKNLGALIVAEEPHVKSWEDGQYNILNMSIEETFGLGSEPARRTGTVAESGTVRPNECANRLTRCATWSLRPAEQQSPRARTRGPGLTVPPTKHACRKGRWRQLFPVRERRLNSVQTHGPIRRRSFVRGEARNI